MSLRPRLSLCIPTYNRAAYLEGALMSGLKEVASHPFGTIEILVCDNASTDETPNLISRIQAKHPELRTFRHDQNLGFDLNHLRCVKEAQGEFVWVMGDDDVWMPGSITRVLRELDAGADACLCLSESCDNDLNPVITLPYYQNSNPPSVWRLESRDELIRYFNTCVRNAGVFAMISVAIFRRDRFLLNQNNTNQEVAWGYHHLWGMMAFLRQPTHLHYIPEILVSNRLFNNDATGWGENFWARWMMDLRAWAQVADKVFGDDPELNNAFSKIVGRNHHNTILPGLRQHAPNETAWHEAKPYLIRAGFSAVRIAAVDFAHQWLRNDRHPLPTLNPASLCLVDLPLLARGAERIAILALGLQSLLDGAGLLAALRSAGRTEHIRVFCPPECAELLDGFELQCLDPKRYAADVLYRESIVQILLNFTPELVVNVDRNRGVEADDLVAASSPAGAIAFELPPRGQDAALIKAANGSYTCLLPRAGGPEAMLEALRLEAGPPGLWPSPGHREKAQAMLKDLGWDPKTTLALLVDHPSILEDPDILAALAEAIDAGWTLVGLGTRATHPFLEALLCPLEDRALNLAGGMGLGSMAALLQCCGASLGGSPLLQSMAKACGCAPFPSNQAR